MSQALCCFMNVYAIIPLENIMGLVFYYSCSSVMETKSQELFFQNHWAKRNKIEDSNKRHIGSRVYDFIHFSGLLSKKFTLSLLAK